MLEETGMDDAELLTQFVEERCEDAFRTLAERHSDMVYATCLRGLGDAQMAEDASQAAFIILARKAGSIRDKKALPGWLFRTATSVVSHMRRGEARRKRREAEVAAMAQETHVSAREEAQWREARTYLNDAVASLGKRQQGAVVQYFLEGKPQKEVARVLGCSEDAVKKLISRGLEKLRGKLARQGAALSVVTLTGFLTTRAAHAAPAGLVDSCSAAAMAGLTGGATALSGAALIAKGAMRMIMWVKIKAVAACVAAVVVVGGIAAPLALKGVAQENGTKPAPVAAEKRKAEQDAGAYGKFNKFCIKHFGAEKEALVYEKFGKDLKIVEEGSWRHISEKSACIAFETNLPAKTSVEYGTTPEYGGKTPEHERHFYIHAHYLRNLKPDTEYHYRIVSVDERGNKIMSKDAVFNTKTIPGAIHIPGDMQGPPYVLDKSDTTYLVTEDLTIDGRAFDVKANNVTLDLDGHTVIYDNKYMGKIGDDDSNFWAYIKNSSFGVKARKVVGGKIFNGTIKQGAGNDAAQVHSIGFNPIYMNNCASWEIAGVTIQYSGPQQLGINFHWKGSNSEVHHNVFLDSGTKVLNRHGTGCRALALMSKDATGLTVHHNLVKRTRQSGVIGKGVYNNEIYVDSVATNSFAVGLPTEGKAYNNRVFGTGSHVCAFGWGNRQQYYQNFIHLEGRKDESVNGFRLSQYMRSERPYEDNLYHDNTIVINGKGVCENVRGVQFFSDPYVKNLLFRNNIIKAMVDQKARQVACVVTQGQLKRSDAHLPIIYRDNTFISNICHIRFGDSYGQGCNHHFYNCKFVRIGNNPDYHTFIFDGGWQTEGHIILDCEFGAGTRYNDVFWKRVSSNASYSAAWTLTMETYPGAKVTIKDKNGKEVFYGNADAEGKISAPLTQCIIRPKEWKPDSEAARVNLKLEHQEEMLTPHTVTVEKDGKIATKTVTMDEKQQIQLR